MNTLVIDGNTVIWFHCQIPRQSYSYEKPISHALFASFYSNVDAKISRLSTFVGSVPNAVPQVQSELCKALVVLVDDLMFIYFINGESFIVHLSWPVISVKALKHGILLSTPQLYILTCPMSLFMSVRNSPTDSLLAVEDDFIITYSHGEMSLYKYTYSDEIPGWQRRVSNRRSSIMSTRSLRSDIDPIEIQCPVGLNLAFIESFLITRPLGVFLAKCHHLSMFCAQLQTELLVLMFEGGILVDNVRIPAIQSAIVNDGFVDRLLVLRDSGQIVLETPFGIAIPLPGFDNEQLISEGDQVLLVKRDTRLCINLKIKNSTIRSILEAVRIGLGVEEFDHVLVRMLQQHVEYPELQEWDYLVNALRPIIPQVTVQLENVRESFRADVASHYAVSKINELVEKCTPNLYENIINGKIYANGGLAERVSKVYAAATPQEAVEHLASEDIQLPLFYRLPEGLALYIRDVIEQCKNFPLTWGKKAKKLIDRGDSIVSYEETLPSNMIFPSDLRLLEVEKLINISKPPNVKPFDTLGMSEYDIVAAQQALARVVAVRTLSIPVGRAMYHYCTQKPLVTERFSIPDFEFSIRLKNAQVTVDRTFLDDNITSWGQFHNGASSALSISKSAEITAAWINFNKPAEPTFWHAGFLLGLGVNGHLKEIATWQAFNYLNVYHTMTSIGLLLGLSCSFIGSTDSVITKLLSVHIFAMLPPGSASINLDPLTQTAAVLGLGLLYQGSGHRRMSEVMLSQITSEGLEYDEGYRLSCGFAIGLINLGKGRDATGMGDLRVTEHLVKTATGCPDSMAPAALVALGLLYMKTGNLEIAEKLSVPPTEYLIDYVRPDILLLRTVAKNLVLWKDIGSSQSWIDSQIPEFLEEEWKLTISEIPRYNVLTGAVFAMGLRFAGSGDLEAKRTLISLVDKFMEMSMRHASTYEARLSRVTLRNCLDILVLALSCVLAGTGDLDLLRRLRKLHGRTDSEVNYGNHMAMHMALGILFLRRGESTLSTSNLAIASLLCSLYPQFPTVTSDNRTHLQAFRHLWVLAAESRCLHTQNENGETSVSCLIELRNGMSQNMTTPCILPVLDEIDQIRIEDPQHWPMNIKLDKETRERLRKGGIVVLSKRVSSGRYVLQEFAEQRAQQGKSILDSLQDRFIIKGYMPSDEPLEDAFCGHALDTKVGLDYTLNHGTTEGVLWPLKLALDQPNRSRNRNLLSDFVEKLRLGVWMMTKNQFN